MNKRLEINGICTAFLLGFCLDGITQSCCSGGVPISNNLGLPLSGSKTIQWVVSYDLNILNTLKDGSRTLEDKARRRLTHSILMQGGYVINKRWSTELFASWVRQERIIKQFGNTNKTATQGVGDAVILAKYNLLNNPKKRVNWLIGAGPKIPLGASDKKDKDEIALNADLQPGSGSWDLVTWSQFSKNHNNRASLTWSGTATLTIKGKNKNYLGSQVYQFGNEWLFITGISDQFVTGKTIWGASFQALFRQAMQDKNDGEKTPGTGGRWLFVRPGLTWKPGFSSALMVSLNVPVYSWVRDTQLSPTIRLNAAYYLEIKSKKAVYK